MILEMYQPCAALRPFVASVVFHEGYLTEHYKELLLPDGGIDLIIDLSERPKHVYNNDDFTRKIAFKNGWISGMRMERITIDAAQGSPMMVIRFKAGGAWAFFGFPMGELSDHVEEIVNIWGPQFEELRERLVATNSIPRRFAIMEQCLLRLGRGRLEDNPIIQHAVDLLDQRISPPSMRQLCGHLGYSQKHVIALFEKFVGMSPKRYARIMRFQKIVQRLEGTPPQSWSRFAHDFGFYDQAHFNNEFRAFSGMNPKKYLQAKGDFLNFLPVS